MAFRMMMKTIFSSKKKKKKTLAGIGIPNITSLAVRNDAVFNSFSTSMSR